MNLHSLKNVTGARKSKTRVGRGNGSKGKTCGRGTKGQMSRSGSRRKPTFEGGQMPLVRRIPKRGFKNRNRKVYVLVNVERLDRFEDGSEVTVDTLRKVGLATGTLERVKILGVGELNKKLTVHAHAFSASAISKITAVGGTFNVIS
ncbi:MAG: 50S ribosomal protein L15 [Kiritimatiellae bacterium]|nr:50S ribosomal protein L15 [Kiritimatiellia bacterium]